MVSGECVLIQIKPALKKAKVHLENGNSVEAEAIYRLILSQYPKNKAAIQGYRSVKLGSKSTTSVMVLPPKRQIEELINLFNQSEFQEVLQQVNALLALFPKAVVLHNLKGACYASLNKLDDAIHCYKHINKIDPNYPDAYNNMGIALKEKGELKAAINNFKKAIKIRPNFVEAWNNIGLSLTDQGKLNKAIETYKQALEIKPDYADTFLNMGNAFSVKGELAAAIDSYKKALKIRPNYAVAFLNMGNAFSVKGELAAAIDSYKNALKIKPDYAVAYYNMGISLNRIGDLDAGIESYKKAIRFKADYTDAYINMAISLRDKGEVNAAINSYKQGLNHQPGSAEIYVSVAELLEKSNELEKLESWLNQAVNTLETVPPDIKFFQAQLLWRTKRFRKAFELIQAIEVGSLGTKCIVDYLNLKAKCYEEFGDFDNSFRFFKQMNLAIMQSDEFKQSHADEYFHEIGKSLTTLRNKSISKIASRKFELSGSSPVFLVGFPRSGTTLMDTILRAHSRIEVVEEQPNVFAAKQFVQKHVSSSYTNLPLPTEIVLEATKRYQNEFRKHIMSCDKDKTYIDKLPLNLLWVGLINQLFPQAKFILVLRHPLDSILSCWMQNFKLNPAMANMVDLDRIVEFYCQSMETFEICKNDYNLNVHSVKYEELINDVTGETTTLLNFLGLDWEGHMEDHANTARKRVKINTPSYSQVVEPIYKTAKYRWLKYERYLEKYVQRVDPWIRKFSYNHE
ncbi:tetratricopeptide repeat protein [Paracoccaceae bacterium]|nr:tetratricopeptide repeat protein [Paracoccaceae bacterium]